jgi:pyruvate dehydrogenase E2 component (dihydrolipoamide acetyltransferase)
MDASGLRAARQDLAVRARANKLSVTEMTGGTFTISNLGLTRVEHFTPIINAPQICILGIGRMTDRAVRGPDGGIELRPHVGLSLTFDHRALDGAPAGDLLTAICAEIEEMQA